MVASKPRGDITWCVDMRKANEAIICKRTPMPTVDEVQENVYGSVLLSKFDLRLGFHVVELEDESRDVTTFASHDGLFRYKRLSLGLTLPQKSIKR